MPRRDPTLRAARAAVLLVALLTVAGSCGVAKGAGAFSSGPLPPALDSADEAGHLGPQEATEAAARTMADTLSRAPYRRALAAVNVVVSVMLLVGGSLLFVRRKAAPWWITQAAVANALWTVADTASQVTQILHSSAALVRAYDLQIAAYLAAEGLGSGEVPLQGVHYLWLWVATFVGLAIVRVAFFAWVAWRVRRPDVDRLLGASP